MSCKKYQNILHILWILHIIRWKKKKINNFHVERNNTNVFTMRYVIRDRSGERFYPFSFLGLFRRKTNRTDATINATAADQVYVYTKLISI